MPIATEEILDVLREYGIHPLDDDFSDIDLPSVGQIEEGESVYSTSLNGVLGRGEDGEITFSDWPSFDDPRTREWHNELEAIIVEARESFRMMRKPRRPRPPEPLCAWYCPVHFFGHGWGIFIRESCILTHALDIAAFVDWSAVHLPRLKIARDLLRSAFYAFFLHEQFHHKVESLGLRLLVSTGSDRYRPYKSNVYRRTFNTSDCIEESLANAESYRRLNEPRYSQRVYVEIRAGLRRYLKWVIPQQPPGYREGVDFLSEPQYRDGLYSLQSQLLDGTLPPSTPKSHWSVAPNMITSLADITDDIYIILPRGARPIFRPTSVDPGATVSSRDLEPDPKRVE